LSQHGITATSQLLATRTAIDVLRKGGTAVDAAIGANAVLGVVEPNVNGIGGDLYAISYFGASDSRKDGQAAGF
jgi:gamma-glutamyltranspeptidase / glutathione hydrolase